MAQQTRDAGDRKEQTESMDDPRAIPMRDGYVTGQDGKRVKVSNLPAGETFSLDGEVFEVVDLVTDAVLVRRVSEEKENN